MARPPLPADQLRRAVPLRLSEQEEAPVQAVADAEHDGNLSPAIRALIAEAIAARAPHPGVTDMSLCVECGVNPVSTPGAECADCRRNS